MKVTLYFIRHGESQANVLPYPHYMLLRDPLLTRKGVLKSRKVARYTPCVDVVLSSFLLRAMQTAHLMFPKKHVYCVPYLNELSNSMDTYPYSVPEQKKRLRAVFGTTKWLTNYDTKLRRTRNMRMFLRLVIKLVNGMNKKHVKVAVVGHSLWMMKFLNIPKPDNNAIVKRSIII